MSKTKEVITYYTERAKTTPWETMPTVGIDNGIGGKCFEVCTVAEIVKRCKGVKSTGRCDLTVKGTKFELKTGCGELGKITYNANGEEVIHIRKVDFYIYAPEYNENYNALKQAYVIPQSDFLSLLDNIGLIRRKKSSYAVKNGFDRPDKITIQSFKNSNKKYNALYDSLEVYGIKAADYFNKGGEIK